MLAPHQGDRPVNVPYREGRLLLLLAHRGGQAVPDLLPQAGQPGGARGGHPRPQRAGRGPAVHVPGRLRGQRRRSAARLLDRHHRLPRVHAVRQGPAHGRAPAPSGSRRRARWPGPPTTARCSTRSRTTPSGPTASTATASARRPPTSWSTRRRTSSSASAWAARAAGYLLLGIGSHTTTEVRYLPRRRARRASGRSIAPRAPRARVRRRPPRRPFYIRTNDTRAQLPAGAGARGRPRAARTGRRSCPTAPDVMLEGVGVLPATTTCCSSASSGLPQLRVTDLRSGRVAPRRVPRARLLGLPRAPTPSSTPRTFRYTLRVAGDARLGLRLRHGRRAASTLLKEQPVLGGYDRAQYVSRAPLRHRARRRQGADLARLPEGPSARRAAPRSSSTATAPTAIPLPVAFSSNRLSLLDRGVVFALAHIRGGGEMGKPWHDDGRMLKKRNTFTDFIAAAEHLVAEGYTSRRPPGRSRAAAPAGC